MLCEQGFDEPRARLRRVAGRRAAPRAAGRQLWLMRADGSDLRPLSDDPGEHHGPAAWSPDGRELAYALRSVREGAGEEIWVTEVATGIRRRVAPVGVWPTWLP